MTLEATVSRGWVYTVVAGAERLGVSACQLLDRAGIAESALEKERWPIDDMTRLWHAAEHCTGDSGFGLKAGAGIQPSSMDVLGFALQSAASLREALVMLQKYQRLISDGGRFQMLPGERTTWLVYHPRQGRLAFSPHQIEAVMAAVVNAVYWLTGAPLSAERVQFSQEQLGPLSGYRNTFACPVDFEQAFSGLLVANEVLNRTLPQANEHLAQVHEEYSAARLAALDMQRLSIEDLRRWLMVQLGPRVPRRAEVARALGVSERTLARQLAERGSSFRQLVDEVRRALALEAVSGSDRPLAEIAQSLGFAESSTFYRAFQRWTGMPPARWRKQHS
ncbi:MAG: AraC family transcriptional regulator [Pseudomonadota bacterium]